MSPVSCGNGSAALRRDFPLTATNACCQSMSSSLKAATSPGRRASRASSSRTARSRNPMEVAVSQIAIRASMSSCSTYRGNCEAVRRGIVGTAATSPGRHSPWAAKKRRYDRRALPSFVEALRVLAPGTLYRCHVHNPFTAGADENWTGTGYEARDLYRDGEVDLLEPYWDVETEEGRSSG